MFPKAGSHFRHDLYVWQSARARMAPSKDTNCGALWPGGKTSGSRQCRFDSAWVSLGLAAQRKGCYSQGAGCTGRFKKKSESVVHGHCLIVTMFLRTDLNIQMNHTAARLNAGVVLMVAV